jgi:1,2-diacylglycerol 3-beta-glucosyltransferase
MRNRILLLALTVAAWIVLKLVDNLVSGPTVLLIMGAVLAGMIVHSLWLLTAQKLSSRKKARTRGLQNSASEPAWQPWVDIFVPAKDEGRVIESTVRNLFKLNYPKFYVWVIDDRSTDNMPEVLQSLKAEFPRLRVYSRSPGTRPGKSAALNDVLPLSKGEVVAVFDADAYVDPDFLNLTLPVLAPEGVGAVQAQKRIYEHQKGFLPEAQASEYALDTYFQMGRDSIGGAVELRGNGELIKRDALIDVGGWNNNAITDDLDLTMKLMIRNWDVHFCQQALVWEEAVTTLKALIRQRRRWAEGSIRRYLDYIFPLNSPKRLSLVERVDTLAFATFFVVPAMVLLEAVSDMVHFLTGVPTQSSSIVLVSLAVFLVAQFNFCMAIKHYRKPMGTWDLLTHSVEVNAYVFAHWLPCIFISFCQILFRPQASTWHRTEHLGVNN